MPVALRSRRQIAPFTMLRPASVEQAVVMKAEPGRHVLMAGGIELIDWLKHGHAVDTVIRLDGIPGLAGIERIGDRLRIGAMATHDAICAAPLPGLAALWPQVANPRVRFAGTIGGNVMCGRADYDGLPALMALGARAELARGGDAALDALDGAGLVTGFVVPASVRLLADRSLRPALTLWLGLAVEGERVRRVRVGVGGAHPRAVCVDLPVDLPIAALGGQSAVMAAQVAEALPEPATDGVASAGYRRRMAGVLTRRLLVRAGDAA